MRRYQVHLLENKKLAVGTVVLHISALRFLYVKVLGQQCENRCIAAGGRLSYPCQDGQKGNPG